MAGTFPTAAMAGLSGKISAFRAMLAGACEARFAQSWALAFEPSMIAININIHFM
jgi:hypothetical protein